MSSKLEEARQIINEVDAQMAELFVKRMKAAELVYEHKREFGLPILDQARENAVIEKNTALIPAEVMQGPGYDWHFRHAIILRQGKVYEARMERFKPGKKRVVLLGDERLRSEGDQFPPSLKVEPLQTIQTSSSMI